MEFASETLRCDPELVIEAVRRNSQASRYMDESLWSRFGVVFELCVATVLPCSMPASF